MSKLEVFQLLLQDNANLFTTQGLFALLNDCIRLRYPQRHQFTYPSLLDRRVYLSLTGFLDAEQQIIHRIMADPFIWCMDAPEQVQSGAQFYQNMGQMLGPGFATDLFIYQTVRDNIQQLQKSLGISGLLTKNIAVRDRITSYPTAADQLLILESDYVLVRETVAEVVKFFTEVADIPPAYNLFSVDENEEKTPTTTAAIQEAATRAVMAEIYTKSLHWEKSADGCWRGTSVGKLDPDEIHLILHLDWDEDKFIFFDAVHQDINRFPWLIAK